MTPKLPLRERWWKKATFQLHLWAGVILGIYFLVVGLTGSLVVYKKELERLMIPELVQVPPQDQRVSFDAMLASVKAAYPGMKLQNVYLYPKGYSWSFRLQGERGRVQAYVDPATGRVLGGDRYEDKFLQWVYDLHVNLLSGKPGLWWNGIGGFCLILMAATGIVIWWPERRFLRSALRYERRAGWKRQNYDLHKLLGLVSSALLILLALTGAYYAFPKEYESALATLTGGPSKTTAPRRTPVKGETPATLEEVLQVALRALPGDPTLFRPAANPKEVHSLKTLQSKDWRTQGDDTVYIDPVTAKIIHIDRHAEQPLGVRLQRDIYALHFGTFGGHTTRVLWILIGLAPGTLFATGLLMWWNRSLSKRREPQQLAARATA